MSADQTSPGFVDTNIWLYAFIEGNEVEKSRMARNLIRTCQPIISVQIINEVCVNLIKKANFTEEQIQQLIDAFYEKYPIVELDQETLTMASKLRQHDAVAFWDSLVIASALQARVEVLYSEDLQHHQIFENRLQIINPFLVSS
jgi:predicted nucleic acid-binding protein